jgi:hypothetical protein
MHVYIDNPTFIQRMAVHEQDREYVPLDLSFCVRLGVCMHVYIYISICIHRMAAREHDREYVPLELSDDEEWIARLFEPIREQVHMRVWHT